MLETIFNFFTGLLNSVLTFAKILVGSSFFLKQHKAKSQSIIIMGNGPSLKDNLKNNLEALKNQTLFGVNNLPSTDVFEKLRPAYFLIVSDEYWNPGTITKHQKVRDAIIQNLIQKTSWPLVFFLPARAKKNKSFIDKIEANSNITISFFNKTPVEGMTAISHFFMSMGWGMPRPHNVLVPSIFNCINAGFKNIYLIGADHSWIPLISVDKNNNALVNQQHFYDQGQDNKEVMHQKSKPRRLHQILEKFMLSFKAYFVLEAFAESKGAHIYNCTPDSFIDAFDRKDIYEAFLSNQNDQIILTSKH